MLSALRGLPRNCFSWAALPSEGTLRELRMSVRQFLLAAAAVATLSSAQAAEPLTSAPAPAIKAPQQGMAVFSSDGHNVGTVKSVDATPDGRISAINVLSGGFMGFGGRVFTVPEERFGLVGTVVRIRLTAEEVQKLPHQRP